MAFAFFYYLITSTIRGPAPTRTCLAEVRSFSSVMLREGIEAVKRQAVLESHAAGEKKIFIQLLYPDGQAVLLLEHVLLPQHPGLARGDHAACSSSSEPLFATVRSPGPPATKSGWSTRCSARA